MASAAPSASSEVYSVAPMLEWTTRHYRYFARLLTQRTTLYTEMYVDSTLIHSAQWQAHLRFDPAEQPVICQLGGANPVTLAEAARRVESMGYAGINLNCGCPSDRVAGKGCFGASLMFTPELVRDCVIAMRAAVRIPVTVKCRLGADDADSYAELARFVAVVAESGCDSFSVHARKCILHGFSPKDNRTIPPLRYHWVQRLAADFPSIHFGLNGGVGGLGTAEDLLALELLEEALLERRRSLPAAPAIDDSYIDAESIASRAEERSWKRAKARAAKAAKDRRSTDAAAAPSQQPEPDSAEDAAVIAAPGEEAGASSAAGCAPAIDADAPGPAAPPPPPPDAPPPAAPPASAAGPAFPVYVRCAPGALAPGEYGVDARRLPRRRALDSVMVGRAAYNDPWHTLADADRRLFGVPNPGLSRREVVARYLAYAEALPASLPPDELDFSANRPFEVLKPLMGLFHGEPGSARFRATLGHTTQVLKLPIAECIERALACVDDAVLDARPP